MWNRGLRILWLSVHRENGRHVHFCFPISLNIFRELLDSFLDLITLVCVFAPQAPARGARVTVHTAKDLLQMVIVLLGSISEDGPYDLVNAATGTVRVSIKIR